VCRGDSGAPTFVDDTRATGAPRRLVAVVSDGGIDCANKDARVRVDTAAVQDWIARVIREELGNRARLER
jgi:secreted trypsin-like serine protease